MKEIKLSERDNDANAFDKERMSLKASEAKAINRILTHGVRSIDSHRLA